MYNFPTHPNAWSTCCEYRSLLPATLYWLCATGENVRRSHVESAQAILPWRETIRLRRLRYD